MTQDSSFSHLNGHNGSSNGLHADSNGAPKKPFPDEAPLSLTQFDPPTLTRRPVLRALIVAPGGKALAARRLERFLVESGHVLRFESAEAFDEPETARRAFEVFDDAEMPDLLLLDTGTHAAALEHLCRRVRETLSPQLAPTTILAIVPHAALSRDPHLWDALRGAGADMLVDADAPQSLLEAWLEGAAQTSRLQRDLAGARGQLAKHQQIDEVTGLLNRRFFFQAAYREVSRARRYGHPLACLMLEIDHLAHFNETYGYGCGDAILKTVAATLRAWTRDSDIVARFAGTKMVMLLPVTGVDGAIGLREKLLRVASETAWRHEGETLPVTLSIGEAQRAPSTPEPRQALSESEAPDTQDANADAPEGGVSVREELADLLADADAALYVAKRGARTPAAFVEYTEGPELESDTF